MSSAAFTANHVRSVPGVTRAYTRCRHGQVHYRTAGPERSDVPVVVLLHQNPASSFEYEALIAALGQDRRVIALDTPGYGMSDPPPEPLTIAGYAEAFADALDALGIDGPVDLYGFHSGTLHALELAILRPAQMRRIVLTGIPMFPAEDRADRLRRAESQPGPDEDGAVARELLDTFWTYSVAARDKRVPIEKAVWNFVDKSRAMHRFTWVYRAVWGWDYARLALVEQPVLLLQPAEDLREVSIAAAALIRGAAVRELPDLETDIFDLAPDRLADEIRAFLA